MKPPPTGTTCRGRPTGSGGDTMSGSLAAESAGAGAGPRPVQARGTAMAVARRRGLRARPWFRSVRVAHHDDLPGRGRSPGPGAARRSGDVVGLAVFDRGQEWPYRPVWSEPEAQRPLAQPGGHRIRVSAQFLEELLGEVRLAAVRGLRGHGQQVRGRPGGPSQDHARGPLPRSPAGSGSGRSVVRALSRAFFAPGTPKQSPTANSEVCISVTCDRGGSRSSGIWSSFRFWYACSQARVRSVSTVASRCCRKLSANSARMRSHASSCSVLEQGSQGPGDRRAPAAGDHRLDRLAAVHAGVLQDHVPEQVLGPGEKVVRNPAPSSSSAAAWTFRNQGFINVRPVIADCDLFVDNVF